MPDKLTFRCPRRIEPIKDTTMMLRVGANFAELVWRIKRETGLSIAAISERLYEYLLPRIDFIEEGDPDNENQL
ncbi:hypothetical protein DSECCO2_547270 [anaerobic digester metagenome]